MFGSIYSSRAKIYDTSESYEKELEDEKIEVVKDVC
jgi:hypothetical protein